MRDVNQGPDKGQGGMVVYLNNDTLGDMPKDDTLTDLDWQMIGDHARRLDVPIPPLKGDIHVLGHRFTEIGNKCHLIARSPTTTRSALLELTAELQHLNRLLLRLRKDWAAERAQARRKLRGVKGHSGNDCKTVEGEITREPLPLAGQRR